MSQAVNHNLGTGIKVEFKLNPCRHSRMTAVSYNSYVNDVCERIAAAVICLPLMALACFKALSGKQVSNDPWFPAQMLVIAAVSLVASVVITLAIKRQYLVETLDVPAVNQDSDNGKIQFAIFEVTKAEAFTCSLFSKLFLFPSEKKYIRDHEPFLPPQVDEFTKFFEDLDLSNIHKQTHVKLGKIINSTFLSRNLSDPALVARINAFLKAAKNTAGLPCDFNTFRFHLLNWLGQCLGHYMQKKTDVRSLHQYLSTIKDPLPEVSKLPFDQKFIFYQGVLEKLELKEDKEMLQKIIFSGLTWDQAILLSYAGCSQTIESTKADQHEQNLLWEFLLKKKKEAKMETKGLGEFLGIVLEKLPTKPYQVSRTSLAAYFILHITCLLQNQPEIMEADRVEIDSFLFSERVRSFLLEASGAIPKLID